MLHILTNSRLYVDLINANQERYKVIQTNDLILLSTRQNRPQLTELSLFSTVKSSCQGAQILKKFNRDLFTKHLFRIRFPFHALISLSNLYTDLIG